MKGQTEVTDYGDNTHSYTNIKVQHFGKESKENLLTEAAEPDCANEHEEKTS